MDWSAMAFKNKKNNYHVHWWTVVQKQGCSVKKKPGVTVYL